MFGCRAIDSVQNRNTTVVPLNTVQAVHCVHIVSSSKQEFNAPVLIHQVTLFSPYSYTLRRSSAPSSGAIVEAPFMKFYKLCVGVETAVLRCTVGHVFDT